MRQIVVAAVWGLSVAALADSPADWVEYAKSVDGSAFVVHRTRIRELPGKQFLLWVSERTATPIPVFTEKAKPTYRSTMEQLRLDCANMTIQSTSKVWYGAKRDVLHSRTASLPPEPVVPESIGDSLSQMFCN